jgi:hypothetical protein
LSMNGSTQPQTWHEVHRVDSTKSRAVLAENYVRAGQAAW